MGWWHDKNDNSMNVGDSRSVVAARPHLREVVQQRRGSRSVAAASGADSGAPRAAAREGGGRRSLLLLRPSYWRHGCYRRNDKRAGGSAPAGVVSKRTQASRQRLARRGSCVRRWCNNSRSGKEPGLRVWSGQRGWRSTQLCGCDNAIGTPTPLCKGFYRTSRHRWRWWRARVPASWRDDGAGAPWAKASTTMTPVGAVFPIEGVVFPACLPRVKTRSIG